MLKSLSHFILLEVIKFIEEEGNVNTETWTIFTATNKNETGDHLKRFHTRMNGFCPNFCYQSERKTVMHYFKLLLACFPFFEGGGGGGLFYWKSGKGKLYSGKMILNCVYFLIAWNCYNSLYSGCFTGQKRSLFFGKRRYGLYKNAWQLGDM